MISPKISIIIPVYNVEKYLRECLDSCINQTLEEIEIICVDDYSPDNSIKILEEYQAKDPRVKILRHQINKNLGAARNTGIENAIGEYIWFIDSDDFIALYACQFLYDAIKKLDVELLAFQGISFKNGADNKIYLSTHIYSQSLQPNKIYYPLKYWKDVNLENFNISPCMYITKRSVLQNFRFREGVWHEDNDFTPILFSSVNSLSFVPETLYHRRINPESITQRPMSQKRLEDLLATLDPLDKFITDNKLESSHFLYKFTMGRFGVILNLLPSCQNIQLKQLKKLYIFMKKYRKHLFKRFIGKIIKTLGKLFKHD